MEMYISQQKATKRRSKPISRFTFKITRDYVTHQKHFASYEKAVAYKYEYLEKLGEN